MRKFIAFLLGLLLLLGTGLHASAQSAAYAEIAAVDTQGFPKVTGLLDVYDAQGQFLTGLQASDLTIYEDGQIRTAETLSESAPPAQIVVAINPGPALGVRGKTGVPRFDHVVGALSAWARSQPGDSRDDLSLVTIAGPLIAHAEPSDWLVSLTSFQPDFRNTTPNLQALAIALDTVTAPAPQPGMKRAVLVITPHMDDPNIENTVAPLIERAVNAKVRVFVWFVDADTYFVTSSANAFKSLALQTGGSFFGFSETESFPDPELYFISLRHVYTFTYTSSLTAGGNHTLGLYAEAPAGRIPALDRAFSIDIQPPNPIFVSPPLQITRQAPAEDPFNAELLLPEQQTIEIIVEYPDGHRRPLARTSLYVDGKVVAENTTASFEKFVWDLSDYSISGQHEIIVEAEDVLGLRKTSMSIPVTLTVVQPPRGAQALLARYRLPIVFGAVGLAGVVLIAILLSGRLHLGFLRTRREQRKRFEDPVTQPVPALLENSGLMPRKTQPKDQSKTGPRRMLFTRAEPSRVPDAPAYLIRLTAGGEPASGMPIPVLEKEMTLGTDPVQAMHVFDDPSIAPLHARIKQAEDGSYIILDNGSVAGTWVNYEPVSREGHQLAHGDRIHFGQLSYRFDLSQPPAESEPKVIPHKPA